MQKPIPEIVTKEISALFIKSSRHDFNLALNESLEKLGTLLNANRAFLFWVSPDFITIKITNEWVQTPLYHSSSAIQNTIQDYSQFPLWQEYLKNPGLWVLNSLSELPQEAFRERKELMNDNVLSCIVTPFYNGQKLAGCLGFEFITEEHYWSQQEKQIIKDYGDLVSAFVSRVKYPRQLDWETQKNENPIAYKQEIFAEEPLKMQLLSDAAIKLMSFDSREQILEYAGETLHELIVDGYVVINELNEEKNVLITRYINGVNQTIEKGIKVLGFHPLGKEYPVIESHRSIGIIKSSVLHKIEGGLNELSFGAISKTKSKIIRALSGISEIYSCGFHAKGKIYGTATVFLRNNIKINLKLVESFLRMVSMAAYREDTYRQLLKSKKEKNDLLENMSEGVIRTDRKGFISYMNRAALDISGYKKHEIIGKNFARLLPDSADIQDLRNKIFEYNPYEDNTIEIPIGDKEGNLKWVEIRGIDLQNQYNELTGFLGVVSDITQSRIKEAALREYELNERTMELKERFLSNMSHEMLTPINGILGVGDILLRRKLSEENRELVKIINQSSEQLLHIIKSIWDTMGLKEGIQKVHEKKFWLSNLILHNMNLFSASAKQKEINFYVECTNSKDTLILADELKINQVLSNLIGNAIKFHQYGGEISFKANWYQKDNKKTRLRIEVIDNGPGIPEEKQKVIFTLFEQADMSVTREHDGLGLGLTIAKELVNLMQGEINFKSTFGRGTHFWFEIPVEKIDEKELESGGFYIKDRTNEQKVLVIADHNTNQKFLRLVFDSQNIATQFANSMEAAKEMYDCQKHFVVFFAPGMPDIKPGELISYWVKQFAYTPPLIALSDKDLCNYLIPDQVQYISDYLPDPSRKQHLLTILNQWKPKNKKPFVCI